MRNFKAVYSLRRGEVSVFDLNDNYLFGMDAEQSEAEGIADMSEEELHQYIEGNFSDVIEGMLG